MAKNILVKVNHTGYCDGFNFQAGEEVSLPQSVLDALGSENYEVLEAGEAEKKEPEVKDPEKKEEKELDGPDVDKQIKNAVVSK